MVRSLSPAVVSLGKPQPVSFWRRDGACSDSVPRQNPHPDSPGSHFPWLSPTSQNPSRFPQGGSGRLSSCIVPARDAAGRMPTARCIGMACSTSATPFLRSVSFSPAAHRFTRRLMGAGSPRNPPPSRIARPVRFCSKQKKSPSRPAASWQGWRESTDPDARSC